jgi:hypothetical protein
MGRVARFLDRAAAGHVQLALAHGAGGTAVLPILYVRWVEGRI